MEKTQANKQKTESELFLKKMEKQTDKAMYSARNIDLAPPFRIDFISLRDSRRDDSRPKSESGSALSRLGGNREAK